MSIMYWLAVLLIIFEGTIIQCMNELSPEEKLQLPKKFRDAFMKREDLSKLLENYIVKIHPTMDGRMPGEGPELDEYDLYFDLGNFPNLQIFFSIYDGPVTRAKIIYHNNTDDTYNQYIKNFIKAHRHEFKQLIIDCLDYEAVWDAFTKDGNYITFPNVVRFEYIGQNNRPDYKLKEVVPNAKMVSLSAKFSNTNCLANMNGLLTLELWNDCIQEHQLSEIFLNNMGLHYVLLHELRDVTTMRLIANNLKNLTTLKLVYPEKSFLYGKIDEEIYQLPSVTQLDLVFRYMEKLGGDLPFEMPNLKRLSLRAVIEEPCSEYHFIEFVEHFEKLNRVDFCLQHVEADFRHEFPGKVNENFDIKKWKRFDLKFNRYREAHMYFERLPST